MFRKLAIALGASTVIAAAAFSPTAASAHGGPHGHHWHGGHGGGFYVGLYPGYVGSDCYIVRKVVWTKYGRRVRHIEVCD